MPQFENLKSIIIRKITSLCAHCLAGTDHNCQLSTIKQEIQSIQGVPLVVNNRFAGAFIPDSKF